MPVWAQPTIRHDLEVTLTPEAHRLSAVDRVDLAGGDLRSITFFLSERIRVSGVTLAGRKVRHTFRKGLLQIELPALAGESVLEIAYDGVFNDPIPEQTLNTDNPGFGVTATIGIRGTMLLAGAQWYPASPNAADAYTLTVVAPAGILAVTAGKPLGHVTEADLTLSRWSVEHPVEGMPLVAGPYILSTRKFGELTAATYFSDALQPLSDSYLAATGRYLEFYAKLLGPYAYGQFAVVENFLPTGYGFPSFTLLGGQVLQLPFIIHTSLGHEIAHCWWGNGVLVDPSQGNWCEGLTTYVADYLYKERQGKGREQRLQWLRDYASLVDPQNDFPLSQFTSRTSPVTQVIGYDKGAMVFHMLRQVVGDETFWKSLRTAYRRYCFQAVTWSDFQAVFENESHRELSWFFKQWVFRTGAPDIKLADVKVKPDAGGYLVSGAIVQSTPAYRFSIEVMLKAGDREYVKNVSVSSSETPFAFRLPEKPLELVADPEVQIFRRLAPGEIPASINALKASPKTGIVVSRSLDRRYLDIARRLAVSLGLDQADIGFEDQFSPDSLARMDVILIGLPGDKRLQPPAGKDFSLDSRGFTLMGRQYDSGRSTFFGVFKDPHKPARNIALFLPESYDTDFSVSAKITHYGHYSYLVFDGARNIVKGTWPAASSPLTKRWGSAADND